MLLRVVQSTHTYTCCKPAVINQLLIISVIAIHLLEIRAKRLSTGMYDYGRMHTERVSFGCELEQGSASSNSFVWGSKLRALVELLRGAQLRIAIFSQLCLLSRPGLFISESDGASLLPQTYSDQSGGCKD